MNRINRSGKARSWLMAAILMSPILPLAGCYGSTGTEEVITAEDVENAAEYPVPEKIRDLKQRLQSLYREWDDPEEAAYHIRQRVVLEGYLDFLQRMHQSPFVYLDGAISTLIPTTALNEHQLYRFDLARKAFQAVLDAGHIRFEDYIKVLVELSGEFAIITFAADVPRGSFGPDFSLEVTLDTVTGDVIGIVADI